MLQAFANDVVFGERYGDGAPWVLALPGWAHSHADFDAVLGGSPSDPGEDLADGGPIARLNTGDLIRVDAEQGTLEVLLESAELAACCGLCPASVNNCVAYSVRCLRISTLSASSLI